MAIKHTKGDLLEQRVDAIVNTVNTVGVMGKGIALQFKRKWPANSKAYEAACKLKQVVPGKMFIFDNGGLVQPKFIINFPTKKHWRHPSKMAFLKRKWAKEHDYRLRKTLWAFTGNRIAVRFEYEWHDEAGQWWRSHGNENWEFDADGYMAKRFASINDQPIAEVDRKFRWERA